MNIYSKRLQGSCYSKCNEALETSAENPNSVMTSHYPDMGSASYWLREISFNQSDALPSSSLWTGLWSSGELGRGKAPPPPFPFPFLAIFFPKQRACSQATQIWVVMRHQYGISALVSKTPFRGEFSGNVVKGFFLRLFGNETLDQWFKQCPSPWKKYKMCFHRPLKIEFPESFMTITMVNVYMYWILYKSL